jgi:hypothetical protein
MLKFPKLPKRQLRKAPRNRCFYYTNNINNKTENEKEKKSELDDNTKNVKSFTELKEAFYKKKGIKKYWSKPVQKGIKNDIDLL